jgi:hypothetical protein
MKYRRGFLTAVLFGIAAASTFANAQRVPTDVELSAESDLQTSPPPTIVADTNLQGTHCGWASQYYVNGVASGPPSG